MTDARTILPSRVDKLEQYRALVERRKACRLCTRLVNPTALDRARLDCDEVGPYANWQGNLDAPVLVVGQDFADQTTYRRLRGWPGSTVATNLELVKLAAAAGFTLQAPVHGQPDDVLFFTNAVLCLKQGRMSSRVPSRCFETCGKSFLRATIELVNPRAVVTLGVGALRALEHAYELTRQGELRVLVDGIPAFCLASGAAVFPRYHPSRTVMNIARSAAEQLEDWRRIGQWLQSSSARDEARESGTA